METRKIILCSVWEANWVQHRWTPFSCKRKKEKMVLAEERHELNRDVPFFFSRKAVLYSEGKGKGEGMKIKEKGYN